MALLPPRRCRRGCRGRRRKSHQHGTGSTAGVPAPFSGSYPSTTSQQGESGAHGSQTSYQEDGYPAASGDLYSTEHLAHVVVRGFRKNSVNSLLRLIQRKTTTTGAAVEIRETRLEGNALIIVVKAEDLPRITRVHNTVYAGLRLSIKPYHENLSIRESGIGSDNNNEPRISIGPIFSSNTDSPPRLSSDEYANISMPADTDTSLLASHSLAASSILGRGGMRILPGLDALAAATTASTELSLPLQQNLMVQPQEMPNNEVFSITRSEEPMMTKEKEKEIEIEFSNITGLPPQISHLCLSQADWKLELALEAINFASEEFAIPNGLLLINSILCLDYNLWNKDVAKVYLQTIVKEVSDKTGLTMDSAIECLDKNGWKVDQAIYSFENLRFYLPFRAFK